MTTTVLTIGHSTHTIEAFINLLQINAITKVVDVRTVPRSRHNPHFNKETLPGSLEAVGINYTHMQGLGGLRHSRVDSLNTGWHNTSFRGFADYMQTKEFEKYLEILIALLRQERLVLMCAEALPWRCHRSLIADALVVHHIPVGHIMSTKQVKPHTITPWAHVTGNSITYPPS